MKKITEIYFFKWVFQLLMMAIIFIISFPIMLLITAVQLMDIIFTFFEDMNQKINKILKKGK